MNPCAGTGRTVDLPAGLAFVFAVAASETADKKITLYLAEDQRALRELFRAHIEMGNTYRVVGESDDGAHVVRECNALKPDLLILDLGLPAVDGLEILRQFQEAGSPLRILVFSSRLEPAVVRQVTERGALGMVEKTASISTLLAGVASVAAGRPYFGPYVIEALQKSLLRHALPQGSSALTDREREVLQLVAAGRSNKDVAQVLGISVRTAENHRHNMMTKLGARNAADLTRVAYELGLVLVDR